LIVDSHCHINYYKENKNLALKDIKDNNILAVWNSVDYEDYLRVNLNALNNNNILPGFGIHPNRAHDYADKLDNIRNIAKESLLLGEIGLDYFFVRDEWKYPLQKKVLEVFLDVAKKQNKIVNLHIRNAYQEIMDLLDSYSVKKVIMHGYDGPKEFLKPYIDRGYRFTIGGTILEEFKERIPQWKEMQTHAIEIPEELLLIETDGPPDINIMPSERLNTIIDELARLRKTSSQEVIDLTRENFLNLIKRDKKCSRFLSFISQ
jgi:TatD DNase family protein